MWSHRQQGSLINVSSSFPINVKRLRIQLDSFFHSVEFYSHIARLCFDLIFCGNKWTNLKYRHFTIAYILILTNLTYRHFIIAHILVLTTSTYRHFTIAHIIIFRFQLSRFQSSVLDIWNEFVKINSIARWLRSWKGKCIILHDNYCRAWWSLSCMMIILKYRGFFLYQVITFSFSNHIQTLAVKLTISSYTK